MNSSSPSHLKDSGKPDLPHRQIPSFSPSQTGFREFLAKRKEGQPFYYSFNPAKTHRTWVRGSDKDLWGLNPDDLKGKLPAAFPDVTEIREDVAEYLGEAMAFDAACGALIQMVR